MNENMRNIISERQSAFNSAMAYLLEHNALRLNGDKLTVIHQRIAPEQFEVLCAKTKMIERIKNTCEQIHSR